MIERERVPRSKSKSKDSRFTTSEKGGFHTQTHIHTHTH